MTEHTYQELQETLKKERDILIQVSILAFIQADGKFQGTNLKESY